MAAIGLRLITFATAVATLLSLLATSASAQDRQNELRAVIARIATALTGGNPADALEPFSKSADGYDQLRGYFAGLTDSYNIVNEAEVMNEEDTATDSRLTVEWSMTLNGKADEPGRQRSAELQVSFRREKGHWKITALSPLSFFDPAT